MKLEQLEPFDPKPAQALLDLVPQEVRPSADRRMVRGSGGATSTFVAMSRSSG
ncbi:hypothetical protein [Streptosporangium sp. NBC_01756]|uniref:hypothetical protein n=1 Tax=Streptosporangium sp. NBC_01756 TaxID=2975950 RepID=UPI002DDC6D7D|nr:hypothetical protein [Streptosporangium sp. NBC_01756]WSC86285.1 hypothetical protein OIE48_39025 [Streptosporangium sp. NBC_01756]